MTSVVQSENLTKRFRSQNGVPAVGNLDLSISEGELFGLVGPDGGLGVTLSIGIEDEIGYKLAVLPYYRFYFGH